MAVVTDTFGYFGPPSANDSSYTTPSKGTSRQTSRHGSSSPNPSSSPPMPPRENSYLEGREEKDVSKDETISILDPRRFTPTLHASLVSEILSLRREVEGKNSSITQLEESLQSINNENVKLNDAFSSGATETRSVKRQMQILENGTLSALEELAKERDVARNTLADTKKRFEESQRRIRAQEQDIDRTHTIWDRDRQNWDKERRQLDLKIHIIEGRLKTVLDEVAAAQVNGHLQFDVESDAEENKGDYRHRRGSDVFSNRSSSVQNRRRESSSEPPNGRFSAMSGRIALSGSKVGGMSLAEELEEDNNDEAAVEDSDLGDGPASPDALPEESPARPRPFSRQSHLQHTKARKILGLATEESEAAFDGHDVVEAPAVKETMLTDSTVWEKVGGQKHYTDTATQYTSLSSPKLQARQIDQTTVNHEGDLSSLGESARIQAYDHVSANSPSSEQIANKQVAASTAHPMISQACQTIEQPPSPPLTPNRLDLSSLNPAALSLQDVVMKTTATQTEGNELSLSSFAANSRDVPPHLDVPIIAIHPPVSRSPSLRKSVVLPPQTKNASSQASIEIPISLRSISVQTEEIRVDTRPIKLPPHLLPSSISSQPSSPSPAAQEKHQDYIPQEPRRQPPPKPREPPPRQASISKKRSAIAEAGDAYPGNNDNGPLSVHSTELRRPIRSESLFAGFEAEEEDRNNFNVGNEYSDDEFVNAEPIRKTLSKVKDSWKLVPQSPSDSVLSRLESHKQAATVLPNSDDADLRDRRANHSTKSSRSQTIPEVPRSRKLGKPPISNPTGKQPDIRRTALITSGSVAHNHQSRSPSIPSISTSITNVAPPPFPVPTRMSSRKILTSVSDGARSPTPNSTNFFDGNSNRDQVRPRSRKPVLRKVRSAAAMSKPIGNSSHQIQSSPPISPSSGAPDSPPLPPLPRVGVTSRYNRSTQQVDYRSQLSSAPSQAASSSTEPAVQQTSVVDAIAQTMVGEWMWKYVRRRTSFGMPEPPQVEFESGQKGGGDNSSSGVRHKRWVWLAPYERAVMWSSKQPTSGPALLGKSGRKLVIQSVLDVKDDTPMPKNALPKSLFGRSILILTPQRALKFTATTRERHYVWLTALSFLSHSTLGVNDLANLPPVPSQEYRPPANQRPISSLRRNPIRDSIRIAKSKGRPEINTSHAFPTPMVDAQQEISRGNEFYERCPEDEEAAEPPQIPRVAAHTRKRSSTNPRPLPPQSFRSHPAASIPARRQINTATSTDAIPPAIAGVIGAFENNQYGVKSQLPQSQDMALNGPPTNFFDAVGTVRMEAFVDRNRGSEGLRSARTEIENARNGYKSADQGVSSDQQTPKGPARNVHRTRKSRTKDVLPWGFDDSVAAGGGGDAKAQQGQKVSGGVGEDPFDGF